MCYFLSICIEKETSLKSRNDRLLSIYFLVLLFTLYFATFIYYCITDTHLIYFMCYQYQIQNIGVKLLNVRRIIYIIDKHMVINNINNLSLYMIKNECKGKIF